MTIDKAIQVLNYLISISSHMPNPDHRDAIKLGIEALKRIKQQRALEACERSYLLPGETRD